jgi:hypothetical protein
MRSSHNNGNSQNIYWKIAGENQDGAVYETAPRRFCIEASRTVTINAPHNGAIFSAPPTFEFNSNGNTEFKLEMSSDSGFDDPKKITKFTFTTKDPNLEHIVVRTLTPSQWTAVKKMLGTATSYFRIRSRDGIGRDTVSEVRLFTVQ